MTAAGGAQVPQAHAALGDQRVVLRSLKRNTHKLQTCVACGSTEDLQRHTQPSGDVPHSRCTSWTLMNDPDEGSTIARNL
eukprot:754082-Pelagomonas_calceolata.AAC.3